MLNLIYYILLIVIVISIYINFIKKDNTKNIKNKKNNITETFNTQEDRNTDSDDKIKVDIYTELIGLDPRYNLNKMYIEDGKIIEKKNVTWEQDFIKNICDEKCGCDPKNRNMCSYTQGSTVFQCPSFCPKCKECHFIDKNKVQEKYESLCSKSKTETDKEKCKKYEDMLRVTKSYCFFKRSKVSNSIKDDINCDIYKPLNNNNYFYDNDVLIRLSFNYKNKKEMNKIDEIDIDTISLGKNEKDFNVFYKTKKEIYLFFNPDISDVKDSIELTIEGKIFFRIDQREQTFKQQAIIGIFERDNYKEDDLDSNNRPARVVKKMKYTDEDFVSYEDDKYQLNYLEESSFLNCYPVNNHSVYNPIKYKKLGEFKKEKLIDSPITWRERVDIARPWIFTG